MRRPSAGTGLYAVYHEVHGLTEWANDLCDGLLLVAADSPEEARQIVREQMGDHFNDCFIEEVIAHEHKVVLEFWRIPPKRLPRRKDQVAVEEVKT